MDFVRAAVTMLQLAQLHVHSHGVSLQGNLFAVLTWQNLVKLEWSALVCSGKDNASSAHLMHKQFLLNWISPFAVVTSFAQYPMRERIRKRDASKFPPHFSEFCNFKFLFLLSKQNLRNNLSRTLGNKMLGILQFLFLNFFFERENCADALDHNFLFLSFLHAYRIYIINVCVHW